VLRVPSDQPTISAAIAAATTGTTILIAPGVYSGPDNRGLSFAGKQLRLQGSGDPATVIVDCAGAANLITFDHNEDRTSAVSGLTIRNCAVSLGAIYALNSSPTIQGNVFENTQTLNGNAVFGFNSSALIEKNTFRDLQCDDQFLSATVTFVNTSLPYIANNVFVGNACRAIDMTLPESAAPVVVNNTMVGNRAGIYIDRQVSTAAHWYSNNLIVGNERGLEVAFEVQSRADDLAAVWQANLVFGNTTDYLATTDLTGRSGNLKLDPQFVSSPVDLHLRSTSAARGAGVSAHAPPEDFDGAPRAGAVDIGAFQFH